MTEIFVKSVQKSKQEVQRPYIKHIKEYHKQSCNVFLYMRIKQNEFRLNTLLHTNLQNMKENTLKMTKY